MKRVEWILALAGIAACSGAPPPEGGPFCGGIAGIPCPGAGECVDDPRDDCDPDLGGADCGGVCECNAIATCLEGHTWDDSSEVCACVPATNPCAAVLCIVGTECVVENGKPACVPIGGEPCGETTCGEGLVCCNDSCGICTPPGDACITLECE